MKGYKLRDLNWITIGIFLSSKILSNSIYVLLINFFNQTD